MVEGFVHPALIAGTLLAGVPLIIHLLNRQRHKPVQWAAMRFVLAAYRKTRRQVQLENLLLLLLRMAAIILLALAIARPFASGDSPIAKLTESRRDLVAIIDASASTGYRLDVDTVYERIVKRVEDIASDMDSARGDRIRLLLAGRQTRLLSWTSPEKALAVLSTLSAPSDEQLDLAAAFAEVHDLVEKDAAGAGTSALEVRLFTDLQLSNFARGEGDLEKTGAVLREHLDALQEFGVRVLAEHLGANSTQPANLAITAVEPLQSVLSSGTPVDIAITIENYGTSPKAAIRVALEVDGERLPSQRIDVDPLKPARAIFPVEFTSAGAHTLVAQLEGDQLSVDDQRPLVLNVPAPIRVLSVNGASAERIEDDETGYLMAVLEPPDDAVLGGSGGSAVFDPREITPDVLADPRFALDFDVIVLANVATLSDAMVTRLEEQVASGASLIVSAGDRMSDIATFNERFFRADGSGLLPAELLRPVAVASRRSSYYRIGSFDEEHPALRFFADDVWKPLLTEVPVYEFLAARPLESAQVLARFDDERKSPALIERQYDNGRVFLWTTTLDNGWTRLPDSPRTLIPLVHEWFRYAGTRRERPRNLRPGESVQLEVASFPRSPELVRPDGSRRPLSGEATELPNGSWLLPEVDGTETLAAGLYNIEFDGTAAQPFAVRLMPQESNLTQISPAEIASFHPALEFAQSSETSSEDAGDSAPSGEIWRWLALLCLLALIGESLWAARLGNKRRMA